MDQACTELATRADAIEARAFCDLYEAAPPPLRARLGLQAVKLAGATVLLAPGLPSPLFNRVIGLGLARMADEDDVAAIAARYRAAGVRGWWLHWNPAAFPSDMPQRLLAVGFRPATRHGWVKARRPTRPPLGVPAGEGDAPPAARRAAAAELDAATGAMVQAFGMPPEIGAWLGALDGRAGWQVHGLHEAEQVVGGACVYVEGETGWLGMAGVLAAHRGHGGQRALLASRIDAAAALGAREVFTETGEPAADEPAPSLRNLEAAGFERVVSRVNLAAPAR